MIFAEQLYRAYCNAAGLVYGSDETPSFHNLKTEQREAWIAVGTKAQEQVTENAVRRMLASLEEAIPKLERASKEMKTVVDGMFDGMVRAFGVTP